MSFPRHAKYMDSGVEWLGQIPSHWAVKRLRFVAELNPSKSEVSHLAADTEVSFLPMEAIGEDGSLELDRVRPLADVQTGYTFFRDGDVTIAKITPCFENGKGAAMRNLCNGIGFGTTELIVTRPKATQTTSTYLHWLFTSRPFRKAGEAFMYGAGGQKRVPDDFVRDFAIGYPPLPEQRLIDAFLEREAANIDALVQEQTRLIDLLKEKRQAVISQAVTKGLNPDTPMKDSGVDWLGKVPQAWTVRSLRTLSSVVRGASPRPAGDPKFFDGDHIPWVTVAEITKDALTDLTETDACLTEAGAEHSRLFRSGTVIYSNSGATLGVPKILRVDACANDGVVGFESLSDLVEPIFLYHYLSSLTTTIRDMVRQGSGQPNLNTGLVKAIPIALPSRPEQLAICSHIEEVTMRFDRLSTEAEEAMTLLQERRSALISAAVTGKIDVRDLAPQPEAVVA